MASQVEATHEQLMHGLTLAVKLLMRHEPKDARIVSDEVLALAALSVGAGDPAVMRIIEAALEHEPS